MLDSGHLVEAGAPEDLLADEGSAFKELYSVSGGVSHGQKSRGLELE